MSPRSSRASTSRWRYSVIRAVRSGRSAELPFPRRRASSRAVRAALSGARPAHERRPIRPYQNAVTEDRLADGVQIATRRDHRPRRRRNRTLLAAGRGRACAGNAAARRRGGSGDESAVRRNDAREALDAGARAPAGSARAPSSEMLRACWPTGSRMQTSPNCRRRPPGSPDRPRSRRTGAGQVLQRLRTSTGSSHFHSRLLIEQTSL